MKIQFWGVRGSNPYSSPDNIRYGCNTPCLSVDLSDDTVLVLEAGTGIHALGKALKQNRKNIIILLSHLHWDHIQGLPFFDPIYQHDRHISIVSHAGQKMTDVLYNLMDGIKFPVNLSDVNSNVNLVTEDVDAFLKKQGIDLQTIPLNHPGGATGIRLNHQGKSLVYCSDNELRPPQNMAVSSLDDMANFSQDCDILIHDAQYINAESHAKSGWGHSIVDDVLTLANKAAAKHVILFHHDPDRTDDELDAIGNKAQHWFQSQNTNTKVTVANEGLILSI